ncbi:MAG: NUDIX domain-containing protein [Sphingomonadaceae bacterium]
MMLRMAYKARSWWRHAFRIPIAGVVVIGLNEEGAILLVRHSYGSGAWMLPGGGCNWKEAPSKTARREMHEELGCTLDRLILTGTSHDRISGAKHTAYIFSAQIIGPVRPDNREIVAAQFFPPDQLPNTLSRFSRARLNTWSETCRNDEDKKHQDR